MANTPDVVSKNILAKLAITAPGFSLELGTPERKIVDAVAEAISESSIDQYLVGSLLDIESKAGLELEQFCGIFGFGRLQGRKATGTVRVELNTANAQDINVPLGSQFYTRQSLPSSGSPLDFSSTQAVIIPAGSYVVDVPVECTVIGTTGNVSPDTIVYVGDILGATSVTNLQALTGGVDVETDDELRQRFKDTFLRSVIGTEDWYLGLCYTNRNVSKAACFGPIKKYATQLEIPADVDSQTPSIISMDSLIAADIKYAWGGDQHVTAFKNLGQTDEVFFRRHDDYDWISGPEPKFARILGGALLPGDVVDLEFEYTTRSSRNDPDLGIANKVDIYVNGNEPYTVTERTTLADITLTNTTTDQLYAGNFARVGTTGVPLDGHRFTRLGSTPVVSFPSIITLTSVVNGTPITANYTQGLDYHLIRSAPELNPNATTLLAGSQYEIAGIEWMPDGPAVGTSLSLSYIYNRVPEHLQAVIKTSKQVATDVLVHQAGYRYITVCLSVEYDRGFVVQQVNNAINERLRSYFAGLPYGAWIEISDVILSVHQVLGVDNVKITKSTDPGAVVTSGNTTTENYGIKTYGDSTDLTMLTEHPYTEDFKLRDNQLPVFLEAIIRRTANR